MTCSEALLRFVVWRRWTLRGIIPLVLVLVIVNTVEFATFAKGGFVTHIKTTDLLPIPGIADEAPPQQPGGEASENAAMQALDENMQAFYNTRGQKNVQAIFKAASVLTPLIMLVGTWIGSRSTSYKTSSIWVAIAWAGPFLITFCLFLIPIYEVVGINFQDEDDQEKIFNALLKSAMTAVHDDPEWSTYPEELQGFLDAVVQAMVYAMAPGVLTALDMYLRLQLVGKAVLNLGPVSSEYLPPPGRDVTVFRSCCRTGNAFVAQHTGTAATVAADVSHWQ